MVTKQMERLRNWPRGFETVFMLTSAETFKFILLINVKMPTIVGILIVGILTFISWTNYKLLVLVIYASKFNKFVYFDISELLRFQAQPN